MEFFPWNVYRTDLNCYGSIKDLPVMAMSGSSFVKVTFGATLQKTTPPCRDFPTYSPEGSKPRVESVDFVCCSSGFGVIVG